VSKKELDRILGHGAESDGIEEVWTNGVPVFRGATGLTGEAPGRLIRRNRD